MVGGSQNLIETYCRCLSKAFSSSTREIKYQTWFCDDRHSLFGLPDQNAFKQPHKVSVMVLITARYFDSLNQSTNSMSAHFQPEVSTRRVVLISPDRVGYRPCQLPLNAVFMLTQPSQVECHDHIMLPSHSKCNVPFGNCKQKHAVIHHCSHNHFARD